MSVRSFHSVFMASAVAGAALGCYLVSLRVASERAALNAVEMQIVQTQRDIRLLQTEIGTRARLSQLERWNVRVLSLSAPSADQILGDKFQLARMIAPERKPAIEAPVVLATAPSPSRDQPLETTPGAAVAVGPAGLLHEAGLKVAEREPAARKPERVGPAKPESPKIDIEKADAKADQNGTALVKKAGAGSSRPARPVRTAKVDPLAPLPAEASTAEGSRTQR